jgi:hypothetical protein
MDEDKLSILFRGQKIELPMVVDQSVFDVKTALIESISSRGEQLAPGDVKLLWKGKVLANNAFLCDIFEPKGKKSKTFRLVATGVSSAEVEKLQDEQESLQRQTARLVKDDLSTAGQQRLKQRAAVGQRILSQQRQKQQRGGGTSEYGFGSIETLSGLPNQQQAHQILENLSKDPGILACMAKHKWKVGTLAELYPEGNVGESPVCVMGLNQNKGAKILLRLRTDDLAGFRKLLSIRKVLYHELAHNIYGDHDNNFFQLMRQIERECNELDWTNGNGLSNIGGENSSMYEAGTYRLGGDATNTALSPRELAAAAAEMRMTEEEREIEENCGSSSSRRQRLLLLPLPQQPVDAQENDNKSNADEMDSS